MSKSSETVDVGTEVVNITDISFSTRQEFKTNAETNAPSKGGVRTTYLVCHASFKYPGSPEEYGCVDADLQKISEITYDSEGHYTSLTTTPLEFDTLEKILEAVSPLVQTHLTSAALDKREDTFTRSILSEVNSIEVPSLYH